MNWLRWYLRDRPHDTLRERRWYLVGLYWFPFLAVVHLATLIVSAALHVTPLVWVNSIVSLPSFILASIALRLGRERLAFRLGTMELLIHAPVGVYALGWSSGLFLPMLAAPLLLGSGAQRAERVTLVVVAVAELLVLRAFGPAVIPFPAAWLTMVFAASAVVGVGISTILVVWLDGAATELEAALVRERERSEELLRGEVAHQVAERSKELGVELARGEATIDARSLSPGERFADRYEVIAPLGEGGMGAVYEVQRTTDAARLALKAITGEVSSTAAARFAREAEIGARVRHRNVISIVDVGLFEGVPYLAMELVRGGSLEMHRERFGDPSWSLPILRQVLDGLAALHAAGVVHRDLKPANVLLGGDARDPAVKISDFGISRLGVVVPGAATSLRLTGTGTMLGTPLYMAPETGSARVPDRSADMFSLGIMAFEMLTGHAPFPVPAVFMAAAGRLPTPVLHAPDVPLEIRRLILGCLQIDAAQRPTVEEARQLFSPIK
jgi:hypothetical protein